MMANKQRTVVPAASASSTVELAGLSDDVLDRLVADLGHVQRMAALDTALRVGQIVVERLFRGDCEAWRRRGLKDSSFRKLAMRPDLTMSPSALYRSVAIYDLSVRLGGLKKWCHLGASHVRLVINLAPELQLRLLRCAEDERWSVERLEAEVRKRTAVLGDRRGRPPLPALVKAVGQVSRLVENKSPVLDETSFLEGLDEESIDLLSEHVNGVRARFEALHVALEDRRRRRAHADPTLEKPSTRANPRPRLPSPRG